MPKTKRSAEIHQQAVRDWRRAVLAFLMLVFVFALSLSDGHIFPDFLTRYTAEAKPQASPVETRTSTLAKGSIYIASPDAQTCEHRQIDNSTWRIRSAGMVSCEQTGSFSSEQPERNAMPARLDAIRDSFLRRK
jgi:hypothetical protein